MKHVREFHEAFGCPAPSVPCVPPNDRLRLRLKLIAEEFNELLEACGLSTSLIDSESLTLEEHVQYAERERADLVKIADALADLDYVVEGMRLECGIDGEPIAREVHRSNMSKVGSEKRPDGKILKGPNYSPPDIAGELRKQGWDDGKGQTITYASYWGKPPNQEQSMWYGPYRIDHLWNR